MLNSVSFYSAAMCVCIDRYLEAWNVVSTHYNKKLHEGSH